MSLRILFVTSTGAEAESLKRLPGIKTASGGFSFGNSEISVLVTGVGSVATSWALTKWIAAENLPELAINAGIAGSFRDQIGIGEVVIPVSDRFADAGIETREGFMTLAEAGLEDPNSFPFKNGIIKSDNAFVNSALKMLKPVNAITVNTASGTASTIERLKKKYDPDIETMEGATFFYICSEEKIPFLAFRAISNMVEPRDRSKWNISLALGNLSEKLKDFFLTIQ
jgi:futalosine hydrolase